MLRKATRFFTFGMYLVGSGFLLNWLFRNGINGSYFFYGSLFLTQLLGSIVGTTELYLLHRRTKSEVTFGESEHVGVLCFVGDEVFETVRISLLSLKHLRGTPKVYVYLKNHRMEVESLCSEFGFNYEQGNFDPPQQFDQFLITNGHTIVYPDAVLVGQRRLNSKISFVELNHSNYSAHALRNDTQDRDASRAYLISSASGSYSVPIYTGGPILIQRKHCNLDSVKDEKMVPSFSEVVATAASTGHRGTITSHPCCECMSHNEVDHNVSSRTARVLVSKRLKNHPEYIDTAKGIVRRYVGWYYMRFFWLRSIGVLLFLALSLNVAVGGVPRSILSFQILVSFLVAQISTFALSKMLGDYRNPLERIRDLILDCEAFLYATILQSKFKNHFGNLHIRLFPFYLCLLAVTVFLSSTLSNFEIGFMPQDSELKIVALIFISLVIVSLYRSMFRHLSARQREFARRSVSITGSSSYESMWIVDLTHRGAAYVSDTSFNLGDESPLVFRVPTVNGDSLITVIGKVTYCAPRGSQYQVGVAFKELSQQALDDLTLYCSVLYPYRQARQIDESENLFDNVNFDFSKSKESRRNMLSASLYLFIATTIAGVLFAQIPVASLSDTKARGVSSSINSTSVALSSTSNSSIYDFDSLALTDSENAQFTVSSTLFIDNDVDGEFSAGDDPLVGIDIELFTTELAKANESQAPTAQSTTDSNGQYSFRFISAGSYFVRVPNLGSEYELSDSSKLMVAPATTQSGYRSQIFKVNSLNNGNIKELAISFKKKFDLGISNEILGLTSQGFLPGDTVTFKVVAINNGPSLALGGYRVATRLSEDFDARSARMTNTGGFSPCGFDGLKIECISNTALAPGESRAYEFTIISNISSSANSTRRSLSSIIEPSKLDRGESEPSYLTSNNSATTVLPVGQPNSIGGRVYFDANENGFMDSGETGIGGVRIGLLQFKDANGNGKKDPGENPEVANDISDPLGYYGVASGKSSFQSLEPSAQYGIVFSKFPNNLKASALDLGEDDLGEGDKKKANNSLPWITLESSQVKIDTNYGLISSPLDLTKKVFIDINKNSKPDEQDIIPSGLDGRLFQWSDINSNQRVEKGEVRSSPIASSLTDNKGMLNFSGIKDSSFPTRYAVEFDLPEGYKIKGENNTGRVRTEFQNSKEFLASNIILIETGSIVEGEFWFDFNLNAKTDNGEFGAGNLNLVLVDLKGKIVVKTTSNSKGRYIFRGVPSGRFFLGIRKGSVPQGFVFGGMGEKTILEDIYGRTDTSIEVLGNRRQQIRPIAILPSSDLQGIVFDQTSNGEDEPTSNIVVSGSGINLVHENQFGGSSVSSESGMYSFQNLQPGKYQLEVQNNKFRTKESIYLVPGKTMLNINQRNSEVSAVNLSLLNGRIGSLTISNSLATVLENAAVLLGSVSVGTILLVLTRRRKLIYRSS